MKMDSTESVLNEVDGRVKLMGHECIITPEVVVRALQLYERKVCLRDTYVVWT
jgi:hypothetical protein